MNPFLQLHIQSKGQVGVIEKEMAVAKWDIWVSGRENERGIVEQDTQLTVNSWSWCHFTVKVGLISQEAKLVFIVIFFFFSCKLQAPTIHLYHKVQQTTEAHPWLQ